jgi:hypothetical protein
MSQQKNKKQNNKLNNFAKYSGLGFEMLGIIFLGTWAGVKLDERSAMEFPLWTVILSLFSVFAALYLTLKNLLKK